jgi:hypothetical protein
MTDRNSTWLWFLKSGSPSYIRREARRSKTVLAMSTLEYFYGFGQNTPAEDILGLIFWIGVFVTRRDLFYQLLQIDTKNIPQKPSPNALPKLPATFKRHDRTLNQGWSHCHEELQGHAVA